MGVGAGLFLCLVVGGGLIGAFYNLGKDLWGQSEDLYEGIFSLLAALIITVCILCIKSLLKQLTSN